MSTNLWLNLSDGYIGSGRRNHDASGVVGEYSRSTQCLNPFTAYRPSEYSTACNGCGQQWPTEPSLPSVRSVSGAGGTGAALNHYKAMLAEGKQALPLPSPSHGKAGGTRIVIEGSTRTILWGLRVRACAHVCE